MMSRLGYKIFVIVFSLAIFCLLFISTLNYISTKKYSTAMFDDISNITLNAAYTTINITMNVETTQHLKAMATSITSQSSQNVRSVIEDAMYMVHYPKIYVAFETGNSLVSYMDESFFPIDSISWDTDINLREESWYKIVKQDSQIHVGDVRELENGPFKGRKVSTVSYPIKRGGEFFGVIAVDVFVDKFQNRFNSFASLLLNSQKVFLVDSSGRIFSHNDEEIIKKQKDGNFKEKLHNELKTSSTQGSFVYTDGSNNKQRAVYKKFTFGWCAVVTERQGDFSSIVFKKVFIDSMLDMSFLGFVGIILFLLLRSALKPIAKI